MINLGKLRVKLPLVIAVGSLLAACSPSQMVQTSCFVGEQNVAIFVADASRIGASNSGHQNVSFEQNGITVALSPEYYALNWQQIKTIEFKYSHSSDNAGRLSLRFKQLSGEDGFKEVGIVQRSCWETTRKFIEKIKVNVRITEFANAPG